MSEQISITATVGAWMSSHDNPMRVIDSVKRGDSVSAIHAMAFYGTPERQSFGDWIRVGDADVTVRLLPKDEQVRAALDCLQNELNKARAEWMTKQQEIMERISKVQALTFDAGDETRTVDA